MTRSPQTLLSLLLLSAVACLVPLVDGVRQTRAVLWAAAGTGSNCWSSGCWGRCSGPGGRAASAGGDGGRGHRDRRPGTGRVAGASVTGTVVFATGALPLGSQPGRRRRHHRRRSQSPRRCPLPAGRAGRPARRRERRRGGPAAPASCGAIPPRPTRHRALAARPRPGRHSSGCLASVDGSRPASSQPTAAVGGRPTTVTARCATGTRPRACRSSW